ncbi:hypothetical protein L596_008479 [Steinernema carpocapsae]|uniref:Uncharacterized protein n=2 Tax=Steinernema carpocapsae TaxID=34508 RepID=A0A4U5PD45_STECR|nr:hypothetical protein L596_008479 [Steinernema carpocapsae]
MTMASLNEKMKLQADQSEKPKTERPLARFRVFKDGLYVDVQEFTFNAAQPPEMFRILKFFASKHDIDDASLKNTVITVVHITRGTVEKTNIGFDTKLDSCLYRIQFHTDQEKQMITPDEDMEVLASEVVHSGTDDEGPPTKTRAKPLPPHQPPAVQQPNWTKRENKRRRMEQRQRMRANAVPRPEPTNDTFGNLPDGGDYGSANITFYKLWDIEQTHISEELEPRRNLVFDRALPPTIFSVMTLYGHHFFDRKGLPSVVCRMQMFDYDLFSERTLGVDEKIVDKNYYTFFFYHKDHPHLAAPMPYTVIELKK